MYLFYYYHLYIVEKHLLIWWKEYLLSLIEQIWKYSALENQGILLILLQLKRMFKKEIQEYLSAWQGFMKKISCLIKIYKKQNWKWRKKERYFKTYQQMLTEIYFNKMILWKILSINKMRSSGNRPWKDVKSKFKTQTIHRKVRCYLIEAVKWERNKKKFMLMKTLLLSDW